MKTSLLVTLCSLCFVLSCGKDTMGDEFQEKQEVQGNQETDGYYETTLIPLNTQVAGSPTGYFRFRIAGDSVTVSGDVQNTPATFHRQYIHTGSNCPGPGADNDLDGNISFDESLFITGGALLPLDSDLSSQSRGNSFPIAGALGNYTYTASTSLGRMLADLESEDPKPDDFLVKLESDENLNLSGRTLVIYGIRSDNSFPIACGTILRSEQR